MLPLVSVGIPVYNGGRYLENSINSIIKQDYQNLEIIISDNASTDETFKICTYYALKDKRIRYSREDQNKGSAYNFNKVFDLSNGDYFMWCAHDDYYDPSYIKKCVSTLEQFPDALQCVSDVIIIDEHDKKREVKFNMHQTLNKSPEERIIDLFGTMWWVQFYGLYRPEAIKNTMVDFGKYGSDVLFILEVILKGDVVKVDEPLFYYRFPIRPKTAIDMAHTISPVKASEMIKTPYTDLAREIIKVILESNYSKAQNDKLVELFLKTSLSNYRYWVDHVIREHRNILTVPLLKVGREEIAREIITSGADNDWLKEFIEKYSITPLRMKAITGDRPIYLWGAGAAGIEIFSALHSNGIHFCGYIDRDPSKTGLWINGIEVFNPEHVFALNERPYVLIASMYADQISETLASNGWIENGDYMEM